MYFSIVRRDITKFITKLLKILRKQLYTDKNKKMCMHKLYSRKKKFLMTKKTIYFEKLVISF